MCKLKLLIKHLRNDFFSFVFNDDFLYNCTGWLARWRQSRNSSDRRGKQWKSAWQPNFEKISFIHCLNNLKSVESTLVQLFTKKKYISGLEGNPLCEIGYSAWRDMKKFNGNKPYYRITPRNIEYWGSVNEVWDGCNLFGWIVGFITNYPKDYDVLWGSEYKVWCVNVFIRVNGGAYPQWPRGVSSILG